MKTKRGFFILLEIIVPAVILLNGLLFYMMHCSGEYLQSTDVWGSTQTISHAEFKNRLSMLETLPSEAETALAEVEQTLFRIEQAEQVIADSRYTNNKEELREQEDKLEALLATVGNKEDYLALQEIFTGVISFETEVGSIGEKAKSMSQTALYGDGWYLGNIAKTERDYYGLEYVVLSAVQDHAWNAVINFQVSDVLAAVMVITAAVLVFYFLQNREEQMLSGITGLLVKAGLLVTVGVLCVYGSNFLMKEFFLETNRFGMSVQSLASFRNCQYVLTMGGFTVVWLVLKLSLFLLLFFVILTLLTGEGKKHCLTAVLFMIFTAAEFALSRYKGELPFLVFLREINIFSAMSPERFFNRYLNLNIAGGAYSRLPIFLVFWCLVFGVGIMLCVRCLGSYHRRAVGVLHQNYDAEISRQYMETRQLWHDFQNHLLTIQALNESGDREGADRYVKELNESILKDQLAAKTGCTPVDLLLYKKQQAARELETRLKLTIQCRLGEMKFAAYDLCSVVGNLLDNALEAVAELPLEARSIELELKQQQGMLFISCKNPYFGERKSDNGKFASTKEEKASHGIGLASVRQVCRKYQGSMEIHTENSVFRVHMLLMEKQ